MKSFLKYWLPVFVWLGLIFLGSTDLMSAAQTSRIIGPILRWFNPDVTIETIAKVQFVVRKAAHLTEYAVLAILIWRALRRGGRGQMKMSILSLAVCFGCALLAASDEFHQSFVTTRTSSVYDVMLDICGALIGLTLCFLFSRRRKKWA